MRLGTSEKDQPDVEAQRGRIDQISGLVQAGGAVVVVTLALAAILVICLVLVRKVSAGERAAVITAAFTVIGTIVGAYTGARVGAAGRDEALKARDKEAQKVQELAAQVDPSQYKEAMRRVDERAADPKKQGR